MASTHPGFPAHPLLRPGVRVCRLADGELQVGLEESRAVVAPDTPETRSVLDGLRDGVPPPAPGALALPAARLCAGLLDRELVVDGSALLRRLGGAGDEEHRRGLSAVYASEREPGAVLDRRAASSVAVEAERLPAVGAQLGRLLAAAGVGTSGPPSVRVHLSDCEPDRDRVDGWLRGDQPHLFVSAAEGRLRVGPFVVPGRTACLRCLDAHLGDHQPRRSLVVRQYVDAPPDEDLLPPPVAADLLQLAVAFAAREVVGWLDGVRPRTWSATVRVDRTLALEATPWPRHARCGCSWGVTVAG